MRADDVRLERVEIDLDDLVVEGLGGIAHHLGVGHQVRAELLGQRGEVARARWRAGSAAMRASNGKTDVVAPSSAPMLQIVALPVALIDSAPGPKYSMILLVPPFTVSSVQR